MLVRPLAIDFATSISRPESGTVLGRPAVAPSRDLVLLIALCRFLPGQAIGTRSHPGSSNALYNYKLAMPVGIAALVILAWMVIAAFAGAWRTRTRDA